MDIYRIKILISVQPFRASGGFPRLNRVFDGQLETILRDFTEELWPKAA